MTTTWMIRNDSGMLRDCWFEPDKKNPGEEIFCIRQIKIFDDGTLPIVKIIRLTQSETLAVFSLLKKNNHLKYPGTT